MFFEKILSLGHEAVLDVGISVDLENNHCLVEEILQTLMIRDAHEIVNNFAILNQEHSRDALHFQTIRDLGKFVDVDFHKLEFAIVALCDFLESRSQLLAGAAPTMIYEGQDTYSA